MKKCIAVLTRGYNNYNMYFSLIKRNKHINEQLIDKTTIILIFHEGNITNAQQVSISKETPALNIQFKNITNNAFKPEKQTITFDPETTGFGLGYRHMCSFWFVDFWNFIEEYEYLLRIDEDCYINSNIDNIFIQLQKYNFITATMSDDELFVTKGLNKFTLDFINGNSNDYVFKQSSAKSPSGPYTNLFGISINKTKHNEMFNNYLQKISLSNKIYEFRWGDLPLWGEAIYYIFGQDTLLIDKSIIYFHGSHNSMINHTPNITGRTKMNRNTTGRHRMNRNITGRPKMNRNITGRPKMNRNITGRPKMNRNITGRPKMNRNIMDRHRMIRNIMGRPKIIRNIMDRPKMIRNIMDRHRMNRNITGRPKSGYKLF